MSLRRKGLCLVPALLGCWSLKPGDAVPDGGRVDVMDARPGDAPDAPDARTLDVVDAAVSSDIPDVGTDARDVPLMDVGTDARDVPLMDVGTDARDVPLMDVGTDARDVPPTDLGESPRDASDGSVFIPTDLRPLWPPGLSTVTTNRPTLRWTGPVEGIELVLCADRACDTSRRVYPISGNSFTIPSAAPLEPRVYYWFLRTGRGSALTPVWQFRVAGGNLRRAEGAFGTSCRDMDNDGYWDIALGAPGPRNASSRGRAYVLFGSSVDTAGLLPVDNPDATNGRAFGWDVAWGDFNGDLRADLAVSSFDSVQLPLGTVGVFQSAGRTFATTPQTLRCPDCASGEFFATRVAAGDVNGDGLDDLFVAKPGRAGGERIYVWLGRSFGLQDAHSLTVASPRAGAIAFGTSVTVAGDLDGDGYGDLVVGAVCDEGGDGSAVCTPSAAGGFHIYFGGENWRTTAPRPLSIYGAVNGRLGREVVPAGDVNEDGYADLLVTGTNGLDANTTGVVHIFYGRPRGEWGTSLAREVTRSYAPAQALGASAAAVDVDNDGRVDLLAGAPGPESALSLPGVHVAWLQTTAGRFETVAVTNVLSGTATRIGYRMSAAGDLNGDGLGDLVVTAPGTLSSAMSTGTAYVWLGRSGSFVRPPSRTIVGTDPNGWLGRGISP